MKILSTHTERVPALEGPDATLIAETTILAVLTEGAVGGPGDYAVYRATVDLGEHKVGSAERSAAIAAAAVRVAHSGQKLNCVEATRYFCVSRESYRA